MEHQQNPEMLILARESRGLSQQALADLAGVRQPTLSQAETGKTPLGRDALSRLAEQTGYPERFFRLNERVYGGGSACLYHRKRVTLPVSEYRRLVAKINVLRIQIAQLMRGVEIGASNQFPRMDIDEYGSPSLVAQSLRAMWKLPAGPIKNLTTAIESAGGLVVHFDFGTRKLDAMSQWLPSLPPLFFVNSEIPADRWRFTLAHELGHLIMHVVPSIDLEREADEFAAELLMPSGEIRTQLSPLTLPRLVDLKRHWRVSMAALARRAKDLGRISADQYRRVVTRMSAMGFRLNEPHPLEPEQPTLLGAIVAAQLRDNGHTASSLADLACCLPREFALTYLPAESRKMRVLK